MIERISPAHLSTYFWWFTVLAIALPICGAVLGGLFVVGSIKISDRISQEKQKAEDAKLVQAQVSAGEAKEELLETRKQLDQATLVLKHGGATRPPRTITAQQREEFNNYVEDVPRGVVGVYTYVNSGQEAQQFAGEIKQMLSDAGFDTGSIVGQIMPVGKIPQGIFISLKDPDKPPPQALKIAEIIEVLGLGYKGTVLTVSLSEEMIIIVGLQ